MICDPTLLYPPSRGYDEESKHAFCGGFATKSSERTPFPLSGPASIIFDVDHAPAKVAVSISLSPDPVDFADFNTSGQVNYLMPFISTHSEGHYCFNVSVSSINPNPSPNDGALATLQVIMETHHGREYQCADITLVKGATWPQGLRCHTPSAVTSPMSPGATEDACAFKPMFPECAHAKAFASSFSSNSVHYDPRKNAYLFGIVGCILVLMY
ncbi:hypothetical protein CROQUDRAFT_720887 [Cronartium quercuum f. sp. fusiforme G11]|uniref:Copper acquisition factor BIM1-like domain-containing protein n=1 Tax=Cronartium quercuum f. sp. fusiforme G11 TaxID=708437 RepID=A0A9P6NSW6_9BASI|nr:hypothetical protein CROQUDRAFT_720887 [Cronartium quercuum f. sp. fusiforme G11]